jgi:PAS domain S-box-containing protein
MELFFIGSGSISTSKNASGAEHELRDIVDTIPAIVWVALPDGSNTYVNSRYVDYSGMEAAQTAGSGWRAAAHPDDLQKHEDKWRASVASGEPHEARFVFAERMGNIDGIWTAACHCEMKMETSSNGMAS